MILLTSLSFSNDIDRAIWDKLSNDAKFEYYCLAVKTLEACRDRLVLTNNALIDSNTLLQKKYTKNGLFLFALAGIDASIEFDCYTGLVYQHYFFDNRAYIGAGGAVKFYSKLGGALIVNIGFTW
jgi:hypothetical protein